MPRVKSEAFDLKDSQMRGPIFDGPDATNKREQLCLWLTREIEEAISARGDVAAKLAYDWDLYEMNRTRSKNAPWPDAADLTSPIAMEAVDMIHARVMQTIFEEPVWTVEGTGESSERAPIVEEFHQRAQEDERFQDVADEWLLRAWIESVGTMEITEAFEYRREVTRKRVALEIDPATNMPVMGDDNQPLLARDPETESYIDATDPMMPSAEIDEESWQPVRLGPDYDIVPFLDFLVLPNHARSRKEIWGYAKRFWRRVPELKWRAERGIYDKDAVEGIGTDNERQTLADEAPQVRTVPTQDGPTAQKELWEVQCLADLDGKGEQWWRATVSRERKQLLRLKKDDRTTRYIRAIPLKKPGTVAHGYSLVDKLRTIIEEDTAVRNMRADKAAMAVAGAVTKVSGGLWDPYDQPIGPRSVIEVRDHNEVKQLQFSDVPQSINIWKQDIRNDADRAIGQNDTSLGVQTEEQRTLGEVQLRAGYAEVRVNLLVKRVKEPMEEAWQARHNIWKRVLRSTPNGVPLRQSMVIGLEARGLDVKSLTASGRITADMLDGEFWGKPRNSVESADKNRSRAMLNQLLAVIPGVMQWNPTFAMLWQTPMAAKSLVERILYVFDWPDKQSILGSAAQGMLQNQTALQDPMAQMLLQMANGVPAMGMGGAPPLGAPAAGQGPPPQGGPPAQNPMGVM